MFMISFFIPVYNYQNFIRESVKSIMEGNFEQGDELIIVNDCSTDNTAQVLEELKREYPAIKVITHLRNKGESSARNTAIENAKNQILFSLDADNLLVPGSIKKLKDFLIRSDADVVAFQELYYFQKDIRKVTKKWRFESKEIFLEDYFSGEENPGYSGNYMFTKKSWVRAGGYPEGIWLGSWGFGFRQLATGSKMVVMPNSYYYHRHGHESNWIKKYRQGKTSLTALQVLIPFLDLINKEDLDYIMSSKDRYVWFNRLKEHPIRLVGKPARKISFYKKSKARMNRLFRNLKVQNISKLEEFYKSFKNYRNLANAEKLKIHDFYLRVNDNTLTTSFDPHYFYQGVWAFRKIKESRVKNHVDVGSELRWVGLLSTIAKVTFIDIRPLKASLKDLIAKKGDILDMPFENNSIDSLSCLHVAEHVGLGRYGDRLDPLGTKKACKELSRILAVNGNLYFSVPVGKERTCFNAHRIHDPETIIKYFADLKLKELSSVNDRGEFIENININLLKNSKYACGLFLFTK